MTDADRRTSDDGVWVLHGATPSDTLRRLQLIALLREFARRDGVFVLPREAEIGILKARVQP